MSDFGFRLIEGRLERDLFLSGTVFCTEISGVRFGKRIFYGCQKTGSKASHSPSDQRSFGFSRGDFIVLPLKLISDPFSPSVTMVRRAKRNISVCENFVFFKSANSYSFNIKPDDFLIFSISSAALKSGMVYPGSKIKGILFSAHPSIEAKMKFLSFGEIIASFIFLHCEL